MQISKLSRPGNAPGQQILVVDDAGDVRLSVNSEVAKTLPHILIRESESGMKAAVELQKNRFDLVVSELEMNDGNGFWLHCFMAEYHKETPLIFVTSDPEKAQSLSHSRLVFSKGNRSALLQAVTQCVQRTSITRPITVPEGK